LDLITISILAPTQSQKVKKAMEGLSDTKAAYQGLTDPSPRTNSGLDQAGETASRHRGDALKIYEVQQKKVLISLLGLMI